MIAKNPVMRTFGKLFLALGVSIALSLIYAVTNTVLDTRDLKANYLEQKSEIRGVIEKTEKLEELATKTSTDIDWIKQFLRRKL